MKRGRVTLLRYNPQIDPAPHPEVYEFPFEPGMSVLDVAFYIYEEVDGTFSFSYCCRNSHCGLCGAKINRRPGLMCRERATPELLLEPLDNLPVIRDLMVDRQDYERRNESLRLFLDRSKSPWSSPNGSIKGLWTALKWPAAVSNATAAFPIALPSGRLNTSSWARPPWSSWPDMPLIREMS